MDFDINVSVKFNVFTKASNECDLIFDGNEAPSGVLRVVPFLGSFAIITLAASNSSFDSLVRMTENICT